MDQLLTFLEQGPGLEITAWFHRAGTGIIGLLLSPLNFLGSEYGVMLLLPIIYWGVDKKLGRRLFVFMLGAAVVKQVFKYALMRPRPYHTSPGRFSPISQTAEPGLPSGHTLFGTVIGMSLASWSRRRSWKLACLAFIVLMGISRMIHGVHYPQDIILGWILGLGTFWAVDKLMNRLEQKSQTWSLRNKILLCAAGFVLGMAGVFFRDAEAAKGFLMPAGALAGGVPGFILEPLATPFVTDGVPVWKRIVRCLAGFLALAGVYLLLRLAYYGIVGEADTIWTRGLYTVRYAILGLWATLGTPVLFRLMRMDSHSPAL